MRLILTIVVFGFCIHITSNSAVQAAARGLRLEQVRAAYGIDKLMQAGIDGRGQTVAVVATGGFLQSDIDEFVKHYNLPTPKIQVVPISPHLTSDGKPVAEFTMDTEIIDAMAPQATILVFEGSAVDSNQVLNGKTLNVLNAILTDGRASIISLSYDSCELLHAAEQGTVLLDITKRIHDAGITFYHGAGDFGAYRCAAEKDSPYTTAVAISFIGASPYVTVLGGTTLSMMDSHYGSEVVWVNAQKKTGTGGGLSSLFPLPDYQQSFLLKDENPKAMRQVPDAAADADPNSGFPFYFSEATGGWVNTGGDSATAPLWAGGTALVNQYLEKHLKGDKGGQVRLRAPEDLYVLATAYAQGKVDLPPFHDVTTGNNLFYTAREGYDLTTGLGTPNFYNIALDLEKLYRTGVLTIAAKSLPTPTPLSQ